MAYHDDNLYIGFRAPLVPKTDKAIIAVMDAKAPFEKRKNPCKKDPKVKLMQVDLGGAGIRSLDWDSKKEKLLILSGVSNVSEKAEDSTIPKLREYEPGNGAPKEVCSFTKKPNQTPEGVSRWKDKRVMVFDDEGEKPSAKILYLIEPTENGGACAFEPK
uniref:WD40-like Beta Propeller Repeat n=2 Tax=Candidatus Kentrum sp. LPFa TaxID=2126335 RepID=A0A450X3P1_9GAMM|nr:MAG: Protein of unknown function (DUF3616) [Candidatus Kentron sp. LPFa]